MIEMDIPFALFGVLQRVPDGYDSENSRRLRNHHQARVLGTNIIISTAFVNCEFLGIKTE
jgi:hypothetical protein